MELDQCIYSALSILASRIKQGAITIQQQLGSGNYGAGITQDERFVYNKCSLHGKMARSSCCVEEVDIKRSKSCDQRSRDFSVGICNPHISDVC